MRDDRHISPVAHTGANAVIIVAILFLTAGWMIPRATADDTPAAVADKASRELKFDEIRERRIEVGRLAEMLSSDWEPISRADYRALLHAARPKPNTPRTTTIDRATYSAVLTGDTLEAGRLAFQVKQLTAKPEMLVLDPLNLALTELGWKKRRAVWGTLDDGRMAVLVERRSGQLSGGWTLKGKRRRRRIDFRIKLTPATVSQMQLQVPAGWRLESSAGHVSGPNPTPTAGWSSWRIDLGSRSSFRLIARRPLESKPARPVILVKSDITHDVRRDARQLQAVFSLNVSGAPAKSFAVGIPENINVLSVIDGNDVNLQHRVIRSRNGRRQLRIQFAEPLLGKSHSVTLHAVVDKPDPEGVLPKIVPLTGAFLSGTVHVRVAAPLTIKSFSATGMRQSMPINDTRAGEMLSLKQWTPDAQLRLVAARPVPTHHALVSSFLDMTGDEWSLKAHIDWSVKNGSTFSVGCGLLPGWKVKQVHVKSSGDEKAERVPADWTLKQVENGRRELVVDLPDSLSHGESISITISASRTPQSRLRRLRFPVLRPLRCESVRHVLGVRHRSRPALADRGSHLWKQIPSAEIPQFARETGVMVAALNAVQPPPTFFLSHMPGAPGIISLNGGRTVADARVWAVVETDEERIRQQITVSIKPVGGPVRQVLVYLPSTERSTVWGLRPEDGRSVSAVRQPLSRHADWNLPATGELWELKLAARTAREFQIVLRRDVDFRGSCPVDLAFVPEARSFHGIVELITKGNSPPTVASVGIQDVANPNAQLAQRPRHVPPNRTPGRLLEFQSAADRMTLSPKANRSPETEIATASLRLKSILAAAGGYDVHTGTYHIDRTSAPRRFQFTLPDDATLVDVRLNGLRVKPIRHDDALGDIRLPVARVNSVEIRYRIPSSKTVLRSRLRVAVPRTSHTITGFDWKLAMPPELRLARAPTFGSLLQPLPQPLWTKRFFGPIGRPFHESVFNPLSWTSWQSAIESDEGRSANDARSEDNFAPPGWNTYRISATTLVDSPEIDAWNHVTARRVAWVVLLTCLTVGILMRRWRMRKRGKIAAFWISLCIVGAWLVSGIYAEIVGSALIGAVIAALIPRNLILRPQKESQVDPQISLGSTASYTPATFPAPLLLLVSFGVLAGTVVAQQPRAPVDRGGTNSTPKTDGAAQGAIDANTVVVPVDKTGSDEPSLVYLHQSLLAKLRTAAADKSMSARSIIRSANYRLRFDEQSSATVEARLHIDVLNAEGSTSVALPFRNIELSGADACKVNGRAQPVRLDPAGFMIDLAKPKRSSTSQARDRAAILASRATLFLGSPIVAMAIGQETVSVTPYEVTLRFRVAFEGDQSSGRLSFDVPSVAASRLVFDSTEQLAFAEISTARGRASFDGSVRKSITVELGRTTSVIAAWSTTARPKQPRSRAEASAFVFAEVHPRYLDYRIYVRCRARTGMIDSAVLNLPREMVVREVRVVGENNSVDSFDIVPHDNRTSRMLVQLTEPHKDPFTLEFKSTLPLKAAGDDETEATIPVFDLFPKDAFETEPSAAAITPVVVHLGIQSSPEFDMKPVTHDAAALADVNAADMPIIEAIPQGMKPPAVLFRVLRPTRLRCQLTPRLPKRTVRQTQDGRFHRGYLEWTMTARVKTSVAPAMTHQLIVDPRLRIDSISVVEDMAPRLVRWSRNGKRITLFLKNKTTATQTITLRARMSLPGPGKAQLPAVRIADATTRESKLTLDRDADCPAELIPPQADGKSDLPATNNIDDGRPVPIGKFDLGPNDPMPRYRIDADVGQRRIDTLTVLAPATGELWSVSTTFRSGKPLRSPSIVRIRIPPELAAGLVLPPKPVLVKSETRADQSVDLKLRLPRSTRRERAITIVSTLVGSFRRERTIPSPVLLDASTGNTFLAMSKKLTGISVVEPSEAIDVDSSPGWIRAALANQGITTGGSIYRRDSLPWKIARRKSAASSEAHVALMETRIMPYHGSVAHGRTTILLLRSNDSALQIQMPQGIAIRAAVVNGHPVLSETHADDLAAIPLAAGRNIQTVVLHWKREIEAGGSPVRRHRHAFPRPAVIPVRKSLLSITQSASARIFSSSGVAAIERLEFLFERVEGLLDACDADDLSIDRRPVFWDVTRSAYLALEREQSIRRNQSEDLQASEEQRLRKIGDRYRALQRSLRGLPIPDGPASRFESSTNGLTDFREFPTGESDFYAVWAADDKEAAISFWTIDVRVLYCVIGVVAFLVITPFVRRIVKLETGMRLSRWEPASWAVLGLIWWACLTPSIVGVALVLTGALRAVIRRRRRTLRLGNSFQLTG